MEVNRALHREFFRRRVLAGQPREVLDIGCGAGELLRDLGAVGVPATGLETDPARVATLRTSGLRVVRGSAEELPFADGSFACVTLRHVLHHLTDPDRALREAWRVARDGVLVAEPWNDPEIPSQRAMTRVDRWLRRRERAAGHIHHANLSAARLLETTGIDPRLAHVEILVPLRPLASTDLVREAHQAGAGPLTAAEQEELGELQALAEQGAITLPGTMLLHLPRSPIG